MDKYTFGSIWVEPTETGKFAIIESEPVDKYNVDNLQNEISELMKKSPSDLEESQMSGLKITIVDTVEQVMDYFRDFIQDISQNGEIMYSLQRIDSDEEE